MLSYLRLMQTSNESFQILAEKKLFCVSIENLDKNASVISSVPDARSVVLWAYDDQRDIRTFLM